MPSQTRPVSAPATFTLAGESAYPFLAQLASSGAVTRGELHLMESLALAQRPASFVEQEVLRMIFSNARDWHIADPGAAGLSAFRRDFGI